MTLESLQRMLASGRDNSLLRFGLGSAHLDAGEPAEAAQHLRRCLEQDPLYSAAWKLLGKALLQSNDTAGAAKAWEQGIETAQQKGDKQAEKEMGVFLRRLQRRG